MSTLLFLVTVVALFVLCVNLPIRALRRKPVTPALRLIGIVVAVYGVLWIACYLKSADRPVPPGTEVCFDDWCATITGAENPAVLEDGSGGVRPHGHFVVLHVKLSNHARGIAQKPSEPRIHIVDSRGHSWPRSGAGQQLLEKSRGIQPRLDQRLELHQTLETLLVFDVPDEARGLVAVIEEGPPITLFLMPEDREVFPL